MEKALRDKATELLGSGEVNVVIGYGWNRKRTHTTPIFITSEDDTDRLVFNERCVNNLSVYLTRKYPDIRDMGRPAIVAKGCDIRSIVVLISEGQLKREDVYIIGMTCGGVVRSQELTGGELVGLTDETLSPKCPSCDVRNPHITDFQIGEKLDYSPPEEGTGCTDEKIRELDGRGAGERWGFWMEHFSRCIKCYACRQYCPLCYCERCIADKNMPQWVETSSHPRGNLSWNLIRAMHLAGRCTFCGECERACPVDIPLNLINQKLASVMKEAFDYKSGYDPGEHPPMIVYSPDDKENFIK
jgi:ferredoxin